MGSKMITTWRNLLKSAMERCGENLSDIIANTMTDEEMDTEFDSDYGGSEGIPFTVWTENRVYFPVTYDGNEWVGSISRVVNMIPTRHIGGE